VQPESRCNRANSPQESLDIDRTSRSNRLVLFEKEARAPIFAEVPAPSPASWMPTCGYGRGGAGLAGGRGHVTSRRAFIESRTQDLPLTLLNGCSNQLKYESNLFTLLQRPNMNTILQNITLDDYILILGSIHPGSG
jgi:hypothetical protein